MDQPVRDDAQAYLGDGVYASYDGYHVWLYCDVEGRQHSIALEDAVLSRLEDFVKRVNSLHGVPITDPIR